MRVMKASSLDTKINFSRPLSAHCCAARTACIRKIAWAHTLLGRMFLLKPSAKKRSTCGLIIAQQLAILERSSDWMQKKSGMLTSEEDVRQYIVHPGELLCIVNDEGCGPPSVAHIVAGRSLQRRERTAKL